MSIRAGDRVITRTADAFNGKRGTVEYVNGGEKRNVGVVLDGEESERMFNSAELLKTRETLSDGSDRVVFSVVQEPTIQIAFSDKPLLELTPAEATTLLRQLDMELL